MNEYTPHDEVYVLTLTRAEIDAVRTALVDYDINTTGAIDDAFYKVNVALGREEE